MASLIRDLAVDASYPIDSDNIMRQVILATHSPYFFQLQDPDDVLLAEETTVRYADSSVKGLRCYALKDSWRATADGGTTVLGLSMMKDYLQSRRAGIPVSHESSGLFVARRHHADAFLVPERGHDTVNLYARYSEYRIHSLSCQRPGKGFTSTHAHQDFTLPLGLT